MATDNAPLPQGTEQQDGWKGHVDQLVRHEDNADGNDQETHEEQWRVDAEGTANLVAADTQQQREEDDAQQPGILHQQVRGHDDEVLVDDHQRHTQYHGKGNGGRGHDDAGAFLHELRCPQALRHYEADDGKVDERSHDGIEDNGEEKSENPAAVPLRAGVGLILLRHRPGHHAPVAPPVLQDVEVAVAAVLEDVGLYLVIALLRIVVQSCQPLLGEVVVADIVVQRRAVLFQRIADIGSQRHADISIHLRLVFQQSHGHRLQRPDERVVAGYLRLRLLQEHLERQLLPLEVLILLRSFVARIGQVEDILLFLRIEHQRVLVRTLHGFHQPRPHTLTLLLVHLYLLRHLAVVDGQLRTQNLKRLRQVLLLHHGLCAQRRQQYQQYSYYPFHLALFSRFGCKDTK